MPQAAAGHNTRVNYYWEDSFAATSAPSDSNPKVPGADAQLTTAEGRNNLRRVYEPGNREAIDLIAMQFEGSFSMQFTLANPWFLQTLMGDASTSGAGPYTHTWESGVNPSSMRIVESYEKANAERMLLGCVPTRFTFEVSVQDVVRVTVEGMYAEEQTDTDPTSLTAQTAVSLDELTFKDATVALGGSTEGYVQDMSLTLEAEAELVREMGDRFAVDFVPMAIQPDVDFGSIKHGDTDHLADMYGTSGGFSAGNNVQQDRMENGVDCVMTFDNGKSNAAQNKLELTLAGTLPESYNESGIGDPQAPLEDTVTRFATTLSAVATNSQSEAL